MRASYPDVQIAPGPGDDRVSNDLPGAGMATVTAVHNTSFSLGAELGLGQGWRVTSELVRNLQHDASFGADASAADVAVFKQLHACTPDAWRHTGIGKVSRMVAPPAGQPTAERHGGECVVGQPERRVLKVGAP